MHRAHRQSGGMILGLWLMAMTGCATSERRELLERSAAQVAYRLPAEQLLEVSRELLKERGYLILESRDPNYVRTSWKAKFDESLDIGGVRERHFVISKELPDGRVVLNAYRAVYTTIGRTAPHPASTQTDSKTGYQPMYDGDPLSYVRPEVVRDLELEWQLLSRVSPSTARELEDQVDEYLAPPPK